MRQPFFSALALVTLVAPAAAQWTDRFDAYPANQVLDNVGGWFGWDNTPAAAATVDGTRSRSFPNSLRVSSTTDAVHPALGVTAGKWTMSAWQFIPTGGLGQDVYFIINNRYSHGGPYSWAVELKCNAATSQVVDDLRTHTPQPVVFDRWVEYRFDINLDGNTVNTYYNGALLSTGVWNIGGGPIAIANIDLFSTGGSCNWDDIELAWRGDAFETYTGGARLDNLGGWFGWDNTPAAAATVDATRARSAPNSLLVNGTTDAVHPGIGITNGRWNVSAWQFIPTGGLTGDIYFIINNRYNHGGPYSWAVELKCNAATGQVVDDLRTHTARPIVFDQWVEYRFDIDLTANTVATYYNGALLSTGVWNVGGGPIAIANFDLFSTGGTCNFDDITIRSIVAPPCFESNIGTALALTDDSTVARPLGFSFPFPGGSTTDIGVCSNGFIWLSGTQTNADFSATVAEFLGSVQATPRLAPAWRDFNPEAAGSDDVYFNTFADRAVITWHNLVRFGGTQPMTVQCQMLADGSFYFFYDVNYDSTGGTFAEGRSLIGIKSGTGTIADPGVTDYSAALPSALGANAYEFFADSANFDLRGRCLRFEPNTAGGYNASFRVDCAAAVAAYGAGCPASQPVTMTSSTPPVIGSTFTWSVSNVPTNTTAAALLLGFNTANVSLTPFGFVGCSSFTSMDLPVALPFTPPTASVSGPLPFAPQLLGTVLHSQAAIVENGFTLYTSNGLSLVFGKN
jgi:hypothetical protein